MKDELLVFSAAKIAMDTYKQRFDNAKAKKEQRFKNLNANFRPGSPMFLEERSRITPEFETEIADAQKELLDEFESILAKTVAQEKAKVTVITSSVKELLTTLQYLENVPVSLDEYNTLIESYGGKFYWLDRFFEKLATKNCIIKTNIQPSLNIKLQILNQLESNVKEYISEYNGKNKTFIVTSSDKYIYKLEKEFTNGYSSININNTDKAKRMVSEALNKGDAMERACILANMLKTSEPDMQEELLVELVERDSGMLSDPTMNFTGVQGMVENFKEKELSNIQVANEAVGKLDSIKSEQDKINTIYNNLDNRHFRKKIEEKIKTGDQELKETYQNMCELKEERENKIAI